MSDQKYIVVRSHRLAHESIEKTSRIVMTMRELMTEFGSYLMFGYECKNVSIDGGTFIESVHPDSSVSPQIIKYTVIEETI